MTVGDLVSSTEESSKKTSGLVLELGNRVWANGAWTHAHAQVVWVNGNTVWEPHHTLEVVHAFM